MRAARHGTPHHATRTLAAKLVWLLLQVSCHSRRRDTGYRSESRCKPPAPPPCCCCCPCW